jgi:hypothetical protein
MFYICGAPETSTQMRSIGESIIDVVRVGSWIQALGLSDAEIPSTQGHVGCIHYHTQSLYTKRKHNQKSCWPGTLTPATRDSSQSHGAWCKTSIMSFTTCGQGYGIVQWWWTKEASEGAISRIVQVALIPLSEAPNNIPYCWRAQSRCGQSNNI